jgi:cobalt-precorrin-5B (C1)-methyltransferase
MSGEFREPDLPRTARVRPAALRTGWTTGACSAAAAKAATACLVTGAAAARVEIGLPSGRRVDFAVHRCETLVPGVLAEAVVVKDAGDDPDVTHGAQLVATVGWSRRPGVAIDGGAGVGVVTRPGLGLPVGQAAINPVPRAMITAAVGEAIAAAVGAAVTDAVGAAVAEAGGAEAGGTAAPPADRGILVVISVPGGERMARRTTNARLGIVGGISILGTTGIVRPFSTAAWRASVEQAVGVVAATGGDTVVLCTGGRTERAALRLRPDLPEVAFIEVGDFTGAALRAAVGTGLRHVVFVGMAGKLTKLASGILMTHYTRSKVDLSVLAELTAAAGGDADLAGAVGAANTGRHGYELLADAGLLRACGDLLCARVADVLRRFAAEAGARLAAEVALVDFTGDLVVAATTPQWVGR